MDKKNTMLLTVIAVATLLVAVVGATFAFFALGQNSTQTGSSAQVTTKGAAGSVLASGGGKNLLLNVTSAQMQSSQQGTYYAVLTGDPVKTAQNHELAKFEVTEAGDKTYTCTFNFTVSSTGLEAVKAGEGAITLTASEGVTLTGGTTFNYADIATAKTVNGTVVLNSTRTSADIKVDATLVNTDKEQQEYLAGLNGTVTTSDIKDFTCTVE